MKNKNYEENRMMDRNIKKYRMKGRTMKDEEWRVEL